jgi:hypothetical protein
MASKSSEPIYVHIILYVVIAILVVVLVKVAIIDPQSIVEQDKFFSTESHLRMKDLKEAEILWEKKHGSFTNNVDSLVNFIKYSPYVDSIKNGVDSITNKSTNPFLVLSNGEFTPDSLFRTPRSQKPYLVQIDTSISADTVVNRVGKIIRIDSTTHIGTTYYIEDPDGYGTVGSLSNLSLKNTVSWE